jgi:hypothetical protein
MVEYLEYKGLLLHEDSLTMNNGVQPRRWMLDEAGELSDGELGSDTLENLYWVKYLY